MMIELILFAMEIILGIIIEILQRVHYESWFLKCGVYAMVFLAFFAEIICIIFLIKIIVKGIQLIRWNLGGCFEETFFREIDECKKGGNENYIQYLLCIKKIDKVYASAEMKKYIQEQRLDKLFERKCYLEKNANYTIRCMDVIKGILLSIVTSNMTDYINSTILMNRNANFFIAIGKSVMIVSALVFICILPYVEQGRNGSYMYEIDYYEIEKLNLSIQKVVSKPVNSEIELRLIACETKRRLCEALYKKHKKKIDIEVIKMELLPKKMPDDCKIVNAKLDGMPIGFILNNGNFAIGANKQDCEKEFKKIKEEKFPELLITDEYRRCYEIIKTEFKDMFELEI